MHRTALVTLTFTAGPWEGRLLQSQDAPAWIRLDEGAYQLTSWRTAHGRERAGYTWQAQHESPA
jgi:hypothetical protein